MRPSWCSAATWASRDQPIIRDPSFVSETDFLIMECTYGDRDHEGGGDPAAELAAILKEAHETGGNVIIPSFAVGRTQELIYFLRELCAENRLDMPIYVDSPLAQRATEVFRKHERPTTWRLTVSSTRAAPSSPSLNCTTRRARTNRGN